MIEATYMGEPVMSQATTGEPDEFAGLSTYRKWRVDSWMFALRLVALKWRKPQIAALYTRIKKYKEQHTLTEQEDLVLSYMIQWFAELYE